MANQVDQDQIVVGIDFGSSYSTVSYWDQGLVKTLHLSGDIEKKTIPSVVVLDSERKCYVGEQALPLEFQQSCTTFRDLKRKILSEQPLSYGLQQIKVQYLISEILLNLKRRVQMRTGKNVSNVVLTTPAYFNEELKTILIDAAKIVGLNVMRIINEPTAAALYYLNKNPFAKGYFLFIDMGGQTLDFTLCNLSEGILDVQKNFGDPSCGYKLVDQQIYEQLLKQLTQKEGEQMAQKFRTGTLKNRLLKIAEEIKIKYSSVQDDTIELVKKIPLDGQDWNFTFRMDTHLYSRCHHLYFKKFKFAYDVLLRNLDIDQHQINFCIVTGGPFSSLFVKNILSKVVLIPFVYGFDNICAVSKGAAIYGARLLTKKQALLSDITSLSIGVELQNGVFQKVIPANSKIPCRKQAFFTTANDFQTKAIIKIIEGQRPIAGKNKVLGVINLKNIEFGVRGTPVIDLTIQVDQNGVIQAYAKDQKLKQKVHLKIDTPNRLSSHQIETIKAEAQKYRPQDNLFLKKMTFRAKIEDLIRYINGFLRDGLCEEPSALENVLRRVRNKLESPQQLSLKAIEGHYLDLKNLVDQLNSKRPQANIRKK